MQDIFSTMGAIFNPQSDLKTVILNRLELPFNFSVSFTGKGYYSEDGQYWGSDRVNITKSKTAITLELQRGGDVRPFKTVCFIRSIAELKDNIESLSLEYNHFFNNFGRVDIY